MGSVPHQWTVEPLAQEPLARVIPGPIFIEQSALHHRESLRSHGQDQGNDGSERRHVI